MNNGDAMSEQQENRVNGMTTSHGELLVYQAENGTVKLEVRLENESLWLSQQQMAELFQTSKQNIGQHLKNIFNEGELHPDSVEPLAKNPSTSSGRTDKFVTY